MPWKGATGQALTHIYDRETRADADAAKVLNIDESVGVGETNVAVAFTSRKVAEKDGKRRHAGDSRWPSQVMLPRGGAWLAVM